MNEADWLDCTDPQTMLMFLGEVAQATTSGASPVSSRKFRLLACACCRRIWDLLSEECSRTAVEVAEQFADGLASSQDRARAFASAAREAAGWANCCGVSDATISFAVSAAAFTAAEGTIIEQETAAAGERVNDIVLRAEANYPELWVERLRQLAPLIIAVLDAAGAAACAAGSWAEAEMERLEGIEEDRPEWEIRAVAAGASRISAACLDSLTHDHDHMAVQQEVKSIETEAQCILIRDIFGNPFSVASVNPTWRTPAVLGIAQAAYENRHLPAGTLSPERLAILADALEDAGCTDAAILNHLRGPGGHCRGCHVIDLLLQKG
jgi:hypothetical protein